MTILGIESSCDETAAAVYSGSGLHSNIIASQSIHEQYGGVVPELASRAHHKTIWPTVQQALDEADTSLSAVEALAVTQGPGLKGSLLVGLCFAKGLCLAQKLPLVGVNHMHAHIYANFIDEKPEYPFVSLTVSGGHTQLVFVKNPFEHALLRAACADGWADPDVQFRHLLGLPHPAGSILRQRPDEGHPYFPDFPLSMLNHNIDSPCSCLNTSIRPYLDAQPNKDPF